jgi:hypothetical protein
MNGGYWYVAGGNGEQFCWAKDATFLCPHGYFDRVRLESGETVNRILTSEVERAAVALGGDPELLARMLERAHASHGAGRQRVDGKLTDLCTICGAKMERKGFACWKQVPNEPDSAQARIAGRLGFSNTRHEGVIHYRPTKKEAEQWARRNANESRSVRA